jgi:hypothetical protein
MTQEELWKWQEQRNKIWESVLTEEVKNRVLEASNEKRLINIHDEDDIGLFDMILVEQVKQNPHYIVQLYRELREIIIRSIEKERN